MNEEQLVARARSGDFKAFADLISAHKTKIYNLALKMTGNPHDAEDIVQETLLKAIDKIDQFRQEASFGTWLYSIALNQSRAHLAQQRLTELKPIEEYLPEPASPKDHRGHDPRLFDWKDPHRVLEDEELRVIIDDALASLPPKYREAFVLRYIDELSIKEIATLIGESVAATKSRVLRARLALRDFLSRAFEDRYGQEVSGIH
jgi:RNA polymerase sigma-70 factor (ECF subfamily)